MAKTQYEVTTVLDFEAPARRRAGIEVPGRKMNNGNYTGPLTDEQLAEIKADKYLVVRELDADGKPVESAPALEQPKPGRMDVGAASGEPTYKDLQARAKELGLSAGGSLEDLQVRVAEAEAAQKPTGDATSTEDDVQGTTETNDAPAA